MRYCSGSGFELLSESYYLAFYNIHMYVVLYFIYCFPVEGYSLAAESSILINYLVRERLYSFIMYNPGRASSIFSSCNKSVHKLSTSCVRTACS